ncbi:phage tail fiber protein [Nonlabens ulvanivorans]|uniref:Phage tail fiber protein n=1 Tax=Nonlabens ulvanivorans TaxID=906888 RepID=A0A081DGK6_NONUL|nr:hypothetical protein [Nonlabens ulvanivorans]GAK78052.1 hypothetical protein JCM19296_3661 [Nonlabens ulvanivorans]GAK91771.1 hypothetical protein JCM19297_1698 [Nonlabens ulvanivorans]GAL02040.1 phage tail fiber protein [Nonlabens ulvanivorans]GAL77082.1 phage tail fiber protein [Nonlabens ulvanivorans]
MNKYILLVSFLSLSYFAKAQTTNPGLLVNIQKASQSEINLYNTADLEIGMLVYNTDVNRIFEYTNNGFTQILTTNDVNETITSLVNNGDGTFTYTSEDNTITNINGTDNQVITSTVTTPLSLVNISLEDGGNTNINIQDADADSNNEVNQTFAIVAGNIALTDNAGTLNLPLTDIDSDITQVVTTGNTISTHTAASGTITNILETVTTFEQDDTTTATDPAATGEITYTDEEGTPFTAQIVSTEADNQIEVGTNGGAYLGPTVYTGTFIISAEGVVTITGIPFQPSQVTFIANANVESLNIDSDNGVGNNDRGIDNSFGTMNGFARNTDGTLVQQAMYSGGHANSINDNSRYASSSNCIGVRYGNQDGSSLGKIEGAFGSFTPDGFNITVNYTNGVVTDNNANPLINVQPTDVNAEALLIIFTAYK